MTRLPKGTDAVVGEPTHREMALLGAFVQGSLDATELANVSAHLACCEPCREEHRRLAEVSDLVRRYARFRRRQ